MSPHFTANAFRWLHFTILLCVCFVGRLWASADPDAGERIYRELCAKCHGAQGEGVPGKHEEALQGNRSLKSLTRLIHRTMPEDEPEQCRDDQAAQVAAYIYRAFYSPQAQANDGKARVELSHLTVRQYRNAVADLCGGETEPLGERHGLKGAYYKSRESKENAKALERIDPCLNFDFGGSSPDTNQIPAEEFSIHWKGSLRIEETGDYEFIVRTCNGVRLWVNNPETPLIDGWVSSGNEAREYRRTLRLLGGRLYPLTLHHFKFKEKIASIALLWKPPHGVLEPIPERSLTPDNAQQTFVVQTPFPPDDGSVGYERGILVSKAWDEATTRAAIEAADYIVENLNRLAGVKSSGDDRETRIRAFCSQFVARAFRRPLSAEQQERFIQTQFNNTDKLESAVKRVVLLALKSPRFLYLGLRDDTLQPPRDDYVAAERLAFGLWDSLPDEELTRAAQRGELHSGAQMDAQAKRMVQNNRARSKVRHFFHRWLQMNQVDNLAKDAEHFPDFTPELIADLRLSLDLFLEDVFWSEPSDYRQLLLADYLFLDDRLAKFYGVDQSGAQFEKVSFDPTQRSGILTHPYLLAAFSYPQFSSPIHRGVFLTRNIVGRALKPPPMAVTFKEDAFDPGLTMREKVVQLTRSKTCQNCHSVINPLGFSLENFDAVGRFRTEENHRPIDAASEYTTDEGETIHFQGARDVATFAATSEQAQRAFVEQLFHEVVKQPALAYGVDTLNGLHESFVTSSFNMRELFVKIAIVAARHDLPSNPE